MICDGQPWQDIIQEARNLSLPDGLGTYRHKSWKSLYEWARDNGLEEARPLEISPREWREIQQRELYEMQQRAEIVRTLALIPQPSSGYIARVHTASGEQVEAQGRDSIGALLQLSQHLWNRFPGEMPQEVSAT